MSNVHMMLQGKGGIGKSSCTCFLAQYLKANGVNFQGIDTDPVNQSFFAFKSLNVKHLEILDAGTVNQRRFDSLIEEIIKGDQDFVIDNGASSFIPLASYIGENKIFDLLESNGAKIILHTPIVAGAAMKDALIGMSSIAEMTRRRNLVVWKNEYFGPVVHKNLVLEEMPVFKSASESVMGVIEIKNRTASTFGDDIKKMLTMGKTFDECLAGDDFYMVEKSRLKIMRDDIYAEIGKVGGDEWITKK